jgi:hypothetical protein
MTVLVAGGRAGGRLLSPGHTIFLFVVSMLHECVWLESVRRVAMGTELGTMLY